MEAFILHGDPVTIGQILNIQDMNLLGYDPKAHQMPLETSYALAKIYDLDSRVELEHGQAIVADIEGDFIYVYMLNLDDTYRYVSMHPNMTKYVL